MNPGGYHFTYAPFHELEAWDDRYAYWRLVLECGHTQKRKTRRHGGGVELPPLRVRCHECECE